MDNHAQTSDSLTSCITHRNKNVPSRLSGTRRSCAVRPWADRVYASVGCSHENKGKRAWGVLIALWGRHQCGKDTVNSLDAPSKRNDMVTRTHVQATESRNWAGLFNDSDAFTSCRSHNVARWLKCIKWYQQSTHFLELSGKLRHGPLRSPGLH